MSLFNLLTHTHTQFISYSLKNEYVFHKITILNEIVKLYFVSITISILHLNKSKLFSNLSTNIILFTLVLSKSNGMSEKTKVKA